MSAYGLTEREQELTRLVLQGYSTTEIAERLVISAHTVQQHLKNIFDKTGVRSRRDLVTKVFFAHYEPRLRDNERRAAAIGPCAAARPGRDPRPNGSSGSRAGRHGSVRVGDPLAPRARVDHPAAPGRLESQQGVGGGDPRIRSTAPARPGRQTAHRSPRRLETARCPPGCRWTAG